jgi:16S rRNA (cytosine967-C5)-methyltransferase
MTARKTALELLYDIEYRSVFSSDAILGLIDHKALSPEDRRLAIHLVYGVVERRLLLDHYLGQLSRTRLNKLDPHILLILRMSLYQLIYLDRIPPSAAVNEAVKLAKLKGSHLGGFVNGVLRSFIRDRGKLTLPDPVAMPDHYLSVVYSHPLWLVQDWLKRFGPAFTEQLLDANNQTPPLTVRINTLKTTVEEVCASLAKDGITAVPSETLPYALTVQSGMESLIQSWRAYKTGMIYVQDLASMLVAEIVDPKPGESVLDLCAAPGSKTTHMAQKMNNQGLITARDVSESKLVRIRNNSARLGIHIIKEEVADGMLFDPSSLEKYDRVLLDAPCSGLGIIRRKPEIRYNRTRHDIGALAGIQKEILKNAAAYVKAGGVLVYSTCSIEPEENEAVVLGFLKSNPGYHLEKTPWSDPDGFVRRYPNLHGTDGFFIAKLKRDLIKNEVNQ